MATITLNIADADLQRVINAACGLFGYQATLPNPVVGLPPVPNPITQAQFARQMVVQDVKSWVVTWESQQAASAAQITAVATANQVGVS